MNVLWVAGPVELREVARLSGSSRASISSALNTLERDGLVTRRRNGTDRRQVLLELTERGRSELRGGMRDQADLEREWFGPLSAQDQEVLTRLLGALADQVRPPKTKLRSSKAW
jgi:DNA-binding MarR family transcriptional regulator